MVNFLRVNLINSFSPNPSVETLLHAYLPHKYVDHTHAYKYAQPYTDLHVRFKIFFY